MRLNLEIYTLPAHWASYLINNDHSSLEDDDIKKCDLFIDCQRKEYPRFWCLECSEDETFSTSNDSGTERLACNTKEYIFDVGVQE